MSSPPNPPYPSMVKKITDKAFQFWAPHPPHPPGFTDKASQCRAPPPPTPYHSRVKKSTDEAPQAEPTLNTAQRLKHSQTGRHPQAEPTPNTAQRLKHSQIRHPQYTAQLWWCYTWPAKPDGDISTSNTKCRNTGKWKWSANLLFTKGLTWLEHCTQHQHRKVEMFSEFAVHTKIDLIGTLYTTSFFKDKRCSSRWLLAHFSHAMALSNATKL